MSTKTDAQVNENDKKSHFWYPSRFFFLSLSLTSRFECFAAAKASQTNLYSSNHSHIHFVMTIVIRMFIDSDFARISKNIHTILWHTIIFSSPEPENKQTILRNDSFFCMYTIILVGFYRLYSYILLPASSSFISLYFDFLHRCCAFVCVKRFNDGVVLVCVVKKYMGNFIVSHWILNVRPPYDTYSQPHIHSYAAQSTNILDFFAHVISKFNSRKSKFKWSFSDFQHLWLISDLLILKLKVSVVNLTIKFDFKFHSSAFHTFFS